LILAIILNSHFQLLQFLCNWRCCITAVPES